MLVPFIAPFWLTLAILVAVMLIIDRRLKRDACGASKAAMASFLAGAVLFVPMFVVVTAILDVFRYRKFEYDTPDQIVYKEYVDLPAAATNIVLFQSANGHDLQFAIGEDDLLAWMEAWVAEVSTYADASPFEVDDEAAGDSELKLLLWNSDFERRGWEMPRDVVRYRGWHSARGAGMDVWFSAESQAAYIAASYW